MIEEGFSDPNLFLSLFTNLYPHLNAQVNNKLK